MLPEPWGAQTRARTSRGMARLRCRQRPAAVSATDRCPAVPSVVAQLPLIRTVRVSDEVAYARAAHPVASVRDQVAADSLATMCAVHPVVALVSPTSQRLDSATAGKVGVD